jgi:hypothetical protein
MNGLLLAAFAGPDDLLAAARTSREEGFRALDAFSPFPIEGLANELGETSSASRVMMFVGGMTVAALAYGLEWYSAVVSYPINSGGRPLHSWPTFVLVPFAIGILAAAITGLVAFLVQSGLPRLHHPLFEINGFERGSSDGFLLAMEPPSNDHDRRRVRDWLREAGAVAIWEMTT